MVRTLLRCICIMVYGGDLTRPVVHASPMTAATYMCVRVRPTSPLPWRQLVRYRRRRETVGVSRGRNQPSSELGHTHAWWHCGWHTHHDKTQLPPASRTRSTQKTAQRYTETGTIFRRSGIRDQVTVLGGPYCVWRIEVHSIGKHQCVIVEWFRWRRVMRIISKGPLYLDIH